MRKADLVDALMKHSTKPNLVIVEEKKETPAERAARRAKPRVIKSKPIPKAAPLKKSELVPNTSPSKAIQEFEESKKAARQKAAKKPAAPKKKAAAKKDFVYMIPGLAVLGEHAIKKQRKAEAYAKDYLKRYAAWEAGTADAPGYEDSVRYKFDKDETRRLAREIKKRTPEGIAKRAAVLKAREKRQKVSSERQLDYIKQKSRREDAMAAKRKEKAAEKALRDADPKKVAAAAKRKATIVAKLKAELKRKYPYLTDADAEAIAKIQGTRKEDSLPNAERRKIGDIRLAAQKRAGIK